MSSLELSVLFQDRRTIRATSQDGLDVYEEFTFDSLYVDLVSLFKNWLLEDKLAKRLELQTFGSLLYRILFPGSVGRLYERCLAEAQNTRQRLRVQVSFTEESAHMASVPWEFLYQPEKSFFATDVDLVFSRYIRSTIMPRQHAVAPADDSRLSILLVSSKPVDLGPVVSNGVIEPIQQFANAYPDLIAVETFNTPTIDGFLDKIEEVKPHVLHFIGHGHFNEREAKGEIALLDAGRNARWVRDNEFADFFVHMRSIPRLAFLHICEGGAVDFSTTYTGLAPQLIRVGVQAVVAMQYPISNDAAVIFSQAFYHELAKGEPIDNAVQNGRWRMTTRIPGAYDSRIFGTPVLYMRSRTGIIQPAQERQRP